MKIKTTTLTRHCEPLHVDKYARNERLHKHLLEIGAFVEPVFTDETRQKIDFLKVTSGVLLEH
jgi:hypothetical protein